MSIATTPAKTVPFNLGRGKSRIDELLTMFNNDGQRAHGLLRVSGNVSNGETVTIGTDVFEVDIINTDSGSNTAADLANSAADAILTVDAAATPAWKVGDLLRVENEIIKVKAVKSATQYLVARARCGTSAALHTAPLDVFESDTPNTVVDAGRIPVGLVTTLTPAVFTPALVAEINADAGASKQSAKTRAISLNTGAQMLLVADAIGVLALATTETGANLAWDAATMAGGVASSVRRFVTGSRVPVAAEVTEGSIYIPVDFNPNAVLVAVRATATGLAVAWVGAITIVPASGATPAYVKIDNTGATDWSVNDTITYLISE